MNAPRKIDLFGTISACDQSGHSLRINYEGAQITVDADSIRAAISVFSTLRASGALNRLDPRLLQYLDDFKIELCVKGKRVGRAGAGISANRLASAVSKIPLELNFLALVRAFLTAF